MIDRVTLIILLATLALVPLPFASVHDWSSGLLVVLCGVMLCGWSAASALGELPTIPTARTRPLVAVFALVIAWALFQISSFAPASWQHPLWRDAAQVLGMPLDGAIAINPGKTTIALLRLCGYGAIFWLAMQFGSTGKRARTIILVIAAAASLYAVYGLAEHFSGTQTILWYPKEAYGFDLTSTFINKNNFATYAGLGVLCVLALLYQSYSQAIEGIRVRPEILRVSLVFLGSQGWRYLLAIFVLIGALLYAHSRAGFASTVVGVLFFCLALGINRRVNTKLVARFSALSFLLVVLFFVLSGRVIDERYAKTDLLSEERPLVYELTLRAIGNQPLLGSGLNGFEDIFRYYRTPDVMNVFTMAHNSYLEAALDLGLPASLLLLALLLGAVTMILRGARQRQRDQAFPCLGVGASALVGVHSMVDFGMQIPAVAVTYTAILGVAYAQSWSSRPSKPTVARNNQTGPNNFNTL